MGTPKKPELKSIDFEAYVEDNRDNLTRAELRDLNKMKNLIDSGEYGVEFNPMLSSYNLVDKEGNIYNEQTGLKLEGDILRRTFGGEKKRISGLMGDIYSNKKYLSKYKYPATESVKDEGKSEAKDASITTQDPQQTASEQKENKPVLPSKDDKSADQSNNGTSANQSKSNDGTGLDEQQKIKLLFSNYSKENKVPEFTRLQESKKPLLSTIEYDPINYSWSDFGVDAGKALVKSSDSLVPVLGTFTNLIYDAVTSDKAAEFFNKKDEVKQTPVVASSIGGYTKEEQAKVAEGLKKQDKTKPAIVSPGALAATGAATVAGGAGLYYGGKYAKTIPSKIYDWFSNTFYPAPAIIENATKAEEAVKPAEETTKKVSRKPALEAVEDVAKKRSKKATQVRRVASNSTKAKKAANIVKKVSKAID